MGKTARLAKFHEPTPEVREAYRDVRYQLSGASVLCTLRGQRKARASASCKFAPVTAATEICDDAQVCMNTSSEKRECSPLPQSIF